ncbi:MAG: NrdH-redoxin [Candidatus Pacebacteria bacterium]|nr:NrdH-redoxin [Candidatus Paceibacterota bacterium]
MTEQKKVIVYSTPTCTYCVLVKDYLKEKGIEFDEIDVFVDREKGKYIVDKTGQMGVPVVQIGDEFIVGFDQPAIAELLDL